MKKNTSKIENILSALLWLFGLFWLETPAVAILTLLAILLHEAGHLCAFLLLGEPTPRLSAQSLGLRLLEARPLSYKREAVVALSGPLANLLCFCLSLLFFRESLGAYVHLFLALGNLLPIETLDGGRILEGMLGAHFEAKTVYAICRAVSFFALSSALLFSLVFLWSKGSGAYFFFFFFSLFLRHLATASTCIAFRRI